VCIVIHLALEGVQCGGQLKLVTSLGALYVAIKCQCAACIMTTVMLPAELRGMRTVTFVEPEVHINNVQYIVQK